MLYNKFTKRPQVMVDCQTCEFFDKKKKRCNGIGKNCFEFDPKTRTAFDPITHLPIKFN